MKNFKELREYLASIPNINSGGCGYATLFMYQWLKIHKPKLKTEIIFGQSYDSSSYHDNDAYFKGLHNVTNSCNHAFLKIKNKYIDCEKYIDLERYPYSHNISNPKFVLITLKNRHNWNSTFDRHWVRIMEKKIGIKLSDI